MIYSTFISICYDKKYIPNSSNEQCLTIVVSVVSLNHT